MKAYFRKNESSLQESSLVSGSMDDIFINTFIKEIFSVLLLLISWTKTPDAFINLTLKMVIHIRGQVLYSWYKANIFTSQLHWETCWPKDFFTFFLVY